ncbi:MAG: hypothetical protein ACI97B_001174 [Verrucomicrobiales bacterium]|jgi:hypothetical protein
MIVGSTRAEIQSLPHDQAKYEEEVARIEIEIDYETSTAGWSSVYFDQMIREHIAGDVFGKDDPDTAIGSAFLVAGPYDDGVLESGARSGKIRVVLFSVT